MLDMDSFEFLRATRFTQYTSLGPIIELKKYRTPGIWRSSFGFTGKTWPSACREMTG